MLIFSFHEFLKAKQWQGIAGIAQIVAAISSFILIYKAEKTRKESLAPVLVLSFEYFQNLSFYK